MSPTRPSFWNHTGGDASIGTRTWISNQINIKLWDIIIWSMSKVQRCFFKPLQLMSNYILHKTMGIITYPCFNKLRPRQHGRHFSDDILKWIFLNENIWISIQISLKLVSRYPINSIPALVQIMAWRRPGDKPLSVPMMLVYGSIYMHHSTPMS